MPIGQPTKFAVVIDLRTAKAPALIIPPLMRIRADEMIEWRPANDPIGRCATNLLGEHGSGSGSSIRGSSRVVPGPA
jgi:hypothetical protein